MYEAEEKRVRDLEAAYDARETKGREEDRKEGIQQSLAQTARNMKELGFAIPIMAKSLGITVDDVAQLLATG